MFDLGDMVTVKPSGRAGVVIEFLREGDVHPLRGSRVDTSYSFVLYDSLGTGEWLNDDVLEVRV